MRNLMKTCLLSMAMLMLMCGAATAEVSFDAQGSILVPDIISRYRDKISSEWTFINLTNITGENVQCQITIYDHDGNEVTVGQSVRTGGSNGVDITLSNTGNFEIPAHSTRRFVFNADNTGQHMYLGYAVIEWNSNDPQQRKALIGGVEKLRTSGNSTFKGEFLINNGQPF